MIMLWATMPFSSISLKTATRYLLLGIISIPILQMMWKLAPGYFEPSLNELLKMPTHDDMFYRAFFQVALPEEFAKFLAFIAIDVSREKSGDDHPVGTMFYYGMVGLSFGLIENIQYATKYGGDVILTRTFTALLLHMLLGLLAGYWYSFAKVKSEKPGRSLFSILCHRFRKFRIVTYSFMAIALVTFIHGVYDYNIFTFTNSSPSLMFTQLGLASLATFLAAKDLISRREKRLR